MNFIALSCSLLIVVGPLVAHAHGLDKKTKGPHVHGLSELNLLAEPSQVVVELKGPAANLLGFESTPRTEAQRKKIDQVGARLKQGGLLVLQGAQCSLKATEVEGMPKPGPVGKKGDRHHHHHDDEHSDLVVIWTYACEGNAMPSSIKWVGFKEFADLEKLDATAVFPRGQASATLSRFGDTLKLQ